MNTPTLLTGFMRRDIRVSGFNDLPTLFRYINY